jgi:UDP:flavonoid glycosyltransferase YjiC (YdhE family)
MRLASDWMMPAIRQSYEDTQKAAQGVDLILSMVGTYASRLVAETTEIPWVSAIHAPLAFFSAYDRPVFDVTPVLSKRLRFLGPAFWKPLFWCGKRVTRFLAKPWYKLRRELGLPDTKEANPLTESHSPLLVLALFSEHFAQRQPDWPDNTVITGFPFLEHDQYQQLPEELVEFLDEGPPPIVFTHGSAVSADAASFFRESIAAAKLLNRRAVLVLGRDEQTPVSSLPENILAVQYTPYSELFPRAAVNVHHGGIGTTHLAMRAGRPMLVVPNAWDQFDNADRVVRLGIARSVPKHRYNTQRAAATLKKFLENAAYSGRAAEIGYLIRQENGVETACDEIENLLRRLQSGQ